jgi:hypothetical protein
MPPITQETFTWPFKDPDWKNKFLIGSMFVFVSSFIPVIGWLGTFVVLGYALLVMRAVMRGDAPTLPKWKNLGGLFVDGLKGALSAAAYLLPPFLLFCCAFVFFFGGLLLQSPTPTGAGQRPSVVSYLPFLLGSLGFMATLSITIAAIFICTVPTPVAVAQYARTGQISAGYHLRQVWTILRTNAGGFTIAWVLYYAISMGLSMVVMILYYTIVLCCVVPFIIAPVGFYSYLLGAFLFGMAYREGIAKAGIITNS